MLDLSPKYFEFAVHILIKNFQYISLFNKCYISKTRFILSFGTYKLLSCLEKYLKTKINISKILEVKGMIIQDYLMKIFQKFLKSDLIFTIQESEKLNISKISKSDLIFTMQECERLNISNIFRKFHVHHKGVWKLGKF